MTRARTVRALVLTSTMLFPLAHVCAQSTAGATDEVQATSPGQAIQGTSIDPAAPSAPDGLSEIVVTAERRVSTVQSTPISIAVVSGDALRKVGIVDLATAVEEVPAVQVQRTNTGASFFIRGIGSRGIGGSPPMSVYEDGIYQQQPNVIAAAFADLNRIEVLRGPQGTLYRRNANGGTINVITHDPVLGRYSSDVTLGYGNYSTVQAQGVVNVPIGETLALRVVADVERHDGYLTSGQDDRNDKVLRAKLLWKPTDRLKLLLCAEELFTDSVGPGNVLISDDVANPRYADPGRAFNVVFTGEPVFCSPRCQSYFRVRNRQYRAEGDYDLGFATLTGLVGIQRFRHNLLQSFAGGIE